MPQEVFEEYPKFYKMPVLMLMLITLLNDGTLISIGYDNVIPSPLPQRWNLPVLFSVAGVLGLVACISSLLLLHATLDSWNEDSLFHSWGVPGLNFGQVTTMIYLKVSISDFLTLFSARTLDAPFYSSMPSLVLLGAGSVALILSTILATAWPESYVDEIYVIGLGRRAPHAMSFYVWLYCLICWLIQDFCKVIFVRWMVKKNIFGE